MKEQENWDGVNEMWGDGALGNGHNIPEDGPVDEFQPEVPEEEPQSNTMTEEEYLALLRQQQIEEQRERLLAASNGQSMVAGDEYEDSDGYSAYGDDGLNFHKDLISDDSRKDLDRLIENARLDENCKQQFMRIYGVFASKDNVLTNSSIGDLYRRNDELSLALTKLERTVDPVNFMYSDFDEIVSVIVSKITGRNTRGKEGFEKITSQTQYVNRKESVGTHSNNPVPQEKEGWGFSRINPFGRH